MPTDPRDTGWTVLSTDADGYSDVIQINGVHICTIRFGAMHADVTEIWFEEAAENSASSCKDTYYDDCIGTTTRLKITVPTGKAETGFTVKVDPGKFGGMNWARIKLTDGTDGVQQSSDVAVTIGGRDYK